MAPRFTPLKRTVAAVIQCRPIGHAIGRIYGDVIPFHGMPIDVKGAEIPAANKASLWWGIYESAEYRFIEKFLRPDLPVIELGSSIGAISSAIARRLVQGQRLMCVEANPRLIPALRRNLARNAPHLVVEIVNAAVSYDGGDVRFGVSADNLTSHIPADFAGDTAIVPGATLASLVAKQPGVPFQLVADIEGAELDILLNDAESLHCCQTMVLELHRTVRLGQVYMPSDLERLLEDCNFKIVGQYGAVVACCRLGDVNSRL